MAMLPKYAGKLLTKELIQNIKSIGYFLIASTIFAVFFKCYIMVVEFFLQVDLTK